MDREIQRYIDEAIERKIAELRNDGAIKEDSDVIYSKVSNMLYEFFAGKKIKGMTDALKRIEDDHMGAIIPMFYRDRQTVSSIASTLNMDDRTVTRNKKRLCLALYEML